MIIAGKGTSDLARFDAPRIKCSNCNETCNHEIIVTGSYIRLYWIPSFPWRKKIIAECDNCLHTTTKKEFSLPLQDAYNDNELLVKRPWWHWAGSLIVLLFILLVVAAMGMEK